MKYVSVAEMIAIEKGADASGHTYAQMMEHAGRGLAEVVHSSYSHNKTKNALGLVGSGNNGGDTLVAFCYLQAWGWQTTAYIVRPRPQNDPLVERFLAAGGKLLEIEGDPAYPELITALESNLVLLDGVLGTGIRLPLRGTIAAVLDLVRNQLQTMEVPPHVVHVMQPAGDEGGFLIATAGAGRIPQPGGDAESSSDHVELVAQVSQHGPNIALLLSYLGRLVHMHGGGDERWAPRDKVQLPEPIFGLRCFLLTSLGTIQIAPGHAINLLNVYALTDDEYAAMNNDNVVDWFAQHKDDPVVRQRWLTALGD